MHLWGEQSEGTLPFQQRVSLPSDTVELVDPAGTADPSVPVGTAGPLVSAGTAGPSVPVGTAGPLVPAGTAGPSVPAGTADSLVSAGTAGPSVPAGMARSLVPGDHMAGSSVPADRAGLAGSRGRLELIRHCFCLHNGTTQKGLEWLTEPPRWPC